MIKVLPSLTREQLVSVITKIYTGDDHIGFCPFTPADFNPAWCQPIMEFNHHIEDVECASNPTICMVNKAIYDVLQETIDENKE